MAAKLPPPKTATTGNIRSTTKLFTIDIALKHFSLAVFAALAAVAQPAGAQEADGQPGLDALIPDEAVENAEQWASSRDQASEDASQQDSVSGADEPLPDLPDLSVEWPDGIDLPQINPVVPGDNAQLALPAQSDYSIASNLEIERLGGNVALALPQDNRSFPIRKEFVDRFTALSTIGDLSGSAQNIAQIAARARSDEALLIKILRAYGYYDGQVLRTVGGFGPEEDGSEPASTAAGAARVRFDIIPGERYRFGNIDLGALGSALDAQQLRSVFEIEPDDPLVADKIVEERADLGSALGESGYPFAVVAEPELLIDHGRAEGDLTMPVSPNGKYVFGSVVSSLPKFLSGKHLSDIARFDAGEVYQRSLEEDLRRAIAATGLVSSVAITPTKATEPAAGQPGTVDLNVELTKAAVRTIAGGIGYGSEEGLQVEASWEHRNLFPPEGSLKLRGILGTREQLAGVTFRKNNFHARDQILSIDAYASTIDSDAFDARTLALVGTFEKSSTVLFQKPLSWSGGLQLLVTDERPAVTTGTLQPRQTYLVASLPLGVLLDTTDNLLDPSEGFRLGARLSPETSRTQGVQSFYVRSEADASFYQAAGDRVVLAARAKVASIPGTALTNIAPSRRLYAGGGASVRGYGYQLIGPRDSLGQLTGGRSLVEAAFEARIKTGLFDGALSVVPFVDAGTVSASPIPGFDDIRVGAGLGIRYASGFGPIRVDVGVPLNPEPEDNPVAVYVSLGQAF